jgi:hypothetical protein
VPQGTRGTLRGATEGGGAHRIHRAYPLTRLTQLNPNGKEKRIAVGPVSFPRKYLTYNTLSFTPGGGVDGGKRRGYRG